MDLGTVASPVLVLGGSGFLGGHLLRALARCAGEIRVLARRPIPSISGVRWIRGDFCDPEILRTVLRGCRTIFHLADATVPETSSLDPARDAVATLLPTLGLLELARRESVERVVFASSGGSVYGAPQRLPIDEHHPAHPISPYGIHKLGIEEYLRLYDRLHGIRTRVLRIANAFGEGQVAHGRSGAVGVFMGRALRGEVLDVWGDGEAIRDYVYVRDVADALVLAACHDGPERTFNIGSGRGRSVNELISSIESLLGRHVARRYLPARPFDVRASVLDISLAARELGWVPCHSFDEGLRRMLEWMGTGVAEPDAAPIEAALS